MPVELVAAQNGQREFLQSKKNWAVGGGKTPLSIELSCVPGAVLTLSALTTAPWWRYKVEPYGIAILGGQKELNIGTVV